MKKFLILSLVGFLSLGMPSSLNATPALQANCFNDFLGCMNDAELEYTSSLAVIEGAEEVAQRRYIAAVTACVGAYRDCMPKP